jgi:2-amino-4-hydroxy-6-hydroxymethyldihydropteridine diphosphokinase
LPGLICYIGIGSNLGDSLQNCREAINRLSQIKEIQIKIISSFYETEPVGNVEQDWFINAVVEIETTLAIRDLLHILQNIEKSLGRVRKEINGPRTIDLDLLFYGQQIIQDTDLIVPHPELHKRSFVLEPLSEIASYFIHPVFGISIRGLTDRLEDNKIIKRIEK